MQARPRESAEERVTPLELFFDLYEAIRFADARDRVRHAPEPAT